MTTTGRHFSIRVNRVVRLQEPDGYDRGSEIPTRRRAWLMVIARRSLAWMSRRQNVTSAWFTSSARAWMNR